MELPVEEQFTNERVREYRGYKLVSTDPFGFWHIEHPEGNRLPDELKIGQFTEYPLAARRVDQYLAQKEAEANKPPLDKNTRKVQEVLKGKE
jgi:hypothetical protein